MNKILIIEDDLEINALLADFLKEKGYACKILEKDRNANINNSMCI